jgi:hypothetical protein
VREYAFVTIESQSNAESHRLERPLARGNGPLAASPKETKHGLTLPETTTPGRLIMISRIFRLVLLFAFILFSIFSYYDRLSQYGTRDEELTLNRINLFLNNPSQAVLTDGSNLSNIIVGIPGRQLRVWLDLHFKEGDRLIGKIYYTKVFPFAIIQVTISLLLIVGCAFVLGKVAGWRLNKDYLCYLLALSVILNCPMLKGLCKVLKYDCFSVILGVMALVAYLAATRQRNFRYFILAIVLGALAFIEKDTAITVVGFIALSEIALTYFETGPFLQLCWKRLRSLLLLGAAFCLTVFAAIPKIWTNPREMGVIFSGIPTNGVAAAPRFLLPAVGVVAALIFFRPRIVSFVRTLRSHLSVKLWFLPLVALFLFALIDQKNDLKWAQSDVERTEIANKGFFVGKTIARVAMTTLDRSKLVTEAKFLLAQGRLVMYFLPAILVLTLILAPLATTKIKHSLHGRAVGLMAAFCLMNLLTFAYLALPIEAKYLASVLFGLTLLLSSFLASIAKQFSDRSALWGSAATLAIVVSLIAPSCQDAPAHFGYMNIFRSRQAEDIGTIEVGDYPWTWVGWGETSYELAQFAGKQSRGKNVAVGYDYLAPFHFPGNVKMVNLGGIWRLEDAAEMDTYLRELIDAKIDYIIISKNTANRILVLNKLLREKRARAVHVDRHGGIEYGWLFRPVDLLRDNAAEGESG